jgi:membrane protein
MLTATGRVWALAKALAARFARDDVGAYAAALTYSLLFALLPLGLALAALVPALHLAAAQRALLSPLTGVVPAEVIQLIGQFSAGAGAQLHQAHGHRTLTLGGAGILGYLWGMSGAFRRLIDAINHAYEYQPPWRRRGWATTALSLALALTLGVGLVMAMILATIGQHIVAAMVPGGAGRPWLAVVRWLVLLALAVVILAVLYWVAPDRPRPFRWVTPGAAAAVIVWLAVSYGFSLYLAHYNSYDAIYGGFGAGILLLLYLYFLSYALLLGAEINAVLERGRVRGGRGPG